MLGHDHPNTQLVLENIDIINQALAENQKQT